MLLFQKIERCTSNSFEIYTRRSSMRYFDTHAHIGLITEDPIDQLIIVQEARQEGVQHLVTVSNNLVDFAQLYENLKTEKQIYHSIGISPSSVVQPGDDWDSRIEDGTRLE